MRKLRVLDLFSAAAGGWSLGMHRAGYRTVAACESVDWRRALYVQNNPGVVIYDDVRTLTSDRILSDLGYLPEFVVGSPPCQDISSANTKGKGVEGERSSLYFEAVRIIGEVRPRWFALENSSNLRTRGADAVLAALEGLDYACWAFVVRASDIGANHERPRSWIIGCDVGQITDTNGFGWNEGWRGRRFGFDISISEDIGDPQKERRDAWSRSEQGVFDEGDGRFSCDDVEYGRKRTSIYSTRVGHERGGAWGCWTQGKYASPTTEGAGESSNTDQTGQEDGLLESSLRQAEITDDGRNFRRRTDGQGAGEMGLCEADRIAAFERRPDWSLDDLADHIRLDAGLSRWMAEQRIAVGGSRGTSAASLIVEAFGDSVVPQIPEAIGLAMLRVESALESVLGRRVA